MTEHEKLLAGLEYDYTDPEIQGLLQKARMLAAEYNALPGGAAARRQEIMGELFGAVGEDVTVQKPFRMLSPPCSRPAPNYWARILWISTGSTTRWARRSGPAN